MSNIGYDNHVTADRRLVVLRLLCEASGYALNSSIINGLLADFGHRVSEDRVSTDLDWLAEQELIELEALAVPGLRIATLKRRGLDVATGRARISGVARPRPLE